MAAWSSRAVLWRTGGEARKTWTICSTFTLRCSRQSRHEQGQLGRGQMGLIGLEQAGKAKGLAVLLWRGELGRFGCPARVAVEKLADQRSQMVERQCVSSVRLDEPCQGRLVALYAVAAKQVHGRRLA